MKFLLSIFFLLMTGSLLAQNFTNKGKEFWVGYGQNQLFGTNAQEMVLYLSAELPANVTVSVNGTTWTRTYSIPANTAITSDLLPKTGPEDCRITGEGLFTKGIHIVSDVPIVAYAHTYGQYTSGATMLLPVETYSYTFFSVNPEQNASASYSWCYVVANENNTTIRITPSRPTVGGHLQNVPFTVNLNKGEMYNIMGAVNGSSSYDISGSKIQSLPGADGICHPVGTFSGSSRTQICSVDPFSGGSDFVMQQVFPINAWGNKYITALTSQSASPSLQNPNKYRVYIREPNTLVRKNGALMTGLINNFYYDIVATTNDVITSTKPILVAQFIPSATGCNSQGLGDPEMFILSPVEQAINNVVFYNTNKESINVNYLTMVIPTNGLSSLLIDGSNAVDYSAPHPNAPGYSIVVKQFPITPMQHKATSDSGFTAITYGLGQYESYGYNAGTNLRNLESSVMIKNIYGTTLTAYTCPGTPFHLVFKTTYRPSTINWHLSAVSGLTPNADVILNNYPVPTDSVTENQRKFYLYELPGNYTFSSTGNYNIPVTLTDQLIENCSFSSELNIPIQVLAGPDADFTNTSSLCQNRSITFTGNSSATILPNKWLWTFGDATIDSVKVAEKIYTSPGTYNVNLTVVRTDGCIASKQRPVTILPASATTLNETICDGQHFLGYSTTGTYTDTLAAVNGCDSIRTLNLTVLPKSTSTIIQSVCAGQSFEGYSTTGIYVDHFTAANGCDSARTLNLTVLPRATSSITQIICEGQSYDGHSTTGIYVDHFTAANGCDSTRTLNLTVNPKTSSTVNHFICAGQTYLGYSASGTYVDHFTNANGCDSTRTLNLTVGAAAASTVNQSICAGQTYLGYSTSGTYVDHFTTANGCDSARTLHLIVNAPTTSTVNHAMCAGQTYLGYSASGTYIDHFTGSNGCDSARTLNLTVTPNAVSTISQTICEGQTYLGYSTSGTYVDHFASNNGCDSARTLHLTVNPKTSSTINHFICAGQTYLGYSASGTYVDHFTNANGCDSTRTLNLTVGVAAVSTVNHVMCAGQTYLGYSTSGTYVDHFTASNGCDSVRTLHLTVNASTTSTINHVMCAGQTYLGYSASGTYVDHFTGSNGCDSARTLNLTVTPNAASTINQTICEGQSYLGYSASGTYVDHFTNHAGCDSARTLILLVKKKTSSLISKTICEGQSYLGYSAAGTYNDTFINANGCDSIRTLKLTISAKPAPNLGPDADLCVGEQLTLSPGNFNAYLWQDGSALDHLVVRSPGTYAVVVQNDCGSGRDEIVIKQKICDPFFPNAFTPNRDGLNDVFKILYSGNLTNYQLRIFNRYGTEIFASRDQFKGWNGTINGQPADPGNYIWTARFSINGTFTDLKGYVLLIR